MVGFCVFMANESCSNAYKLTGFNDLIKFYDARRILRGLLVLARLTYCAGKKKVARTIIIFGFLWRLEFLLESFYKGWFLIYDAFLKRSYPSHLKQEKNMFKTHYELLSSLYGIIWVILRIRREQRKFFGTLFSSLRLRSCVCINEVLSY